jgi:RimK-like ATP-grasp domain
MGRAMRLYYVNDDVPEITTDQLNSACCKRGIEFIEVYAPAFLFDPASQLVSGDLLYRAAISLASMRVEQFLFAEGVSTFYSHPDGVCFGYTNAPLLFQRAGLPVPRRFPLASPNRELIRRHVKAVGGLPVVVKLPGSGGIGTIIVDTLPALFSLLDLLFSQKQLPAVCAFIDEAVHWRLIVVGHRVVSCYRNITEGDDFRTYASSDKADFVSAPSAMAELAIKAVSVLGLEFGGVDILEHRSGRIYLLESNFPCFFGQPQMVAGIDVAGAMLDHLISKARQLSASKRDTH